MQFKCKYDLTIWTGSSDNVAYQFVIDSPEVARMFCLSYLDNFRDGRFATLWGFL